MRDPSSPDIENCLVIVVFDTAHSAADCDLGSRAETAVKLITKFRSKAYVTGLGMNHKPDQDSTAGRLGGGYLCQDPGRGRAGIFCAENADAVRIFEMPVQRTT
jgi:hypothetical protein